MFKRKKKELKDYPEWERFLLSCNPKNKQLEDVFQPINEKVTQNYKTNLPTITTLMVNIRLIDDDDLRSKLYEYLLEELIFYLLEKEGV